MLRDPTKRSFSQWVMKTHMRIPVYNDQRPFQQAASVGMRRTRRFAACWDAGLEYHDGPASLLKGRARARRKRKERAK